MRRICDKIDIVQRVYATLKEEENRQLKRSSEEEELLTLLFYRSQVLRSGRELTVYREGSGRLPDNPRYYEFQGGKC